MARLFPSANTPQSCKSSMKLQIPVIDIEPAFSAHEDPLSLFPFRRFGHYNEAGNRIVAATVLESLSPGGLGAKTST